MKGIYSITNLVNGKIYVGQSKNIHKRFQYHLKRLRYKNHANRHLQSAWDKYGAEKFQFAVIEDAEHSIESLDILEKRWIEFYHASNRAQGYNKTYGCKFGKIHPDSIAQTVKKLRLKTISPEQRKKISQTLMGRVQPQNLIDKRAKGCRKATDQEEKDIIQLITKHKLSIAKIAKKLNKKETLIYSIWKRHKKLNLN